MSIFTRQLIAATGDRITQLKVDLYDYLLKQDVVHDLVLWKVDVSPGQVIRHETLDDLCKNEIEEEDKDDEGYSLTYGGPPYLASRARVRNNRQKYLNMRSELLRRLKMAQVSEEEFLRSP